MYKCIICGYKQETDDFCPKCKESNYPIIRRSFMREIRDRTDLEKFKEKLDDFSDAVSDFFQYDDKDSDIEGLLDSRIDCLEEVLIEMYKNKKEGC